MALKDWKKLDDDKSMKRWIKTDNAYIRDVVKIKYYSHIIEVHYGNNNRQDFKTKSQALKFAKSYMRTH